MRRSYGILPWGIIVLGILHMAATWRNPTLTAAALWFFSAGIAMVLTGSLNLLNHAYGAIAPGLRWCCRGTNVFMLCFTALSGVVTKASVTTMTIIVGLFGAATILSWMRAAGGGPPDSDKAGAGIPEPHSDTIGNASEKSARVSKSQTGI